MKDLDEYEAMFMIFASSLAQFGSDIDMANFKGEVGFISNRASRMLEQLYIDIVKDIQEAKKYQKEK